MELYKQIILSHIIDYLKFKKYKFEKYGKVLNLLCPFCKNSSLTAQNVAQTYKIKCHNPSCPRKGKKFTLISIVRSIEKDKKTWDKEKIIQYIKELFKIKTLTPKDEEEINKWFDIYGGYGFSLVPIKKNDKKPIENDWTNKEHKNKSEWKEWISNGLNVGVRTGEISNLTIIDVDQRPIPEEIKKIMGNTLIQKTKKGYHLFYQYEKDFPKTRIDKLKMDIENDRGQIVLFPSIVEDTSRSFINSNPIIKIPKEFKEFLKKYITVRDLKSLSEKTLEEIKQETFKKPLLNEGDGRHDLLFHLGCMYRKQLNLSDTEFSLNLVNKVICSPVLPQPEMRNIINSIQDYNLFDEKELANQILLHLKEVDEATHRDIERIIAGDNRLSKEEKRKIDKTIAYLIKEDYIQKRGRLYFPVRKLDWKTDLIEGSKPLPFKVPYFYDLGYFCWGDVIIIGAMPGIGKTHIAINIIKQLSIQGIAPYYISLETGSRFKKIGLQLGLTENNFYHSFCYDPTKVELEKKAVTIIDWLNPFAFKDTHLIFGHFAQQLDKHDGLLIVFVQLKTTKGQEGQWFAGNLINQFCALSIKYFYDDEDGLSGHFERDKIRESIIKRSIKKIPCQFNRESKELIRVDELENKEEPMTEQVLPDEHEE